MLKINQLVSGYGTVQILNGANMKVDNQSIVALLGGNGTGKSTILKATSGLIRAWKGSIEFDGEQIHNLPPHEIVGRGLVQVTQGKDVFPAMSVTENLRLGGFILKTKKQLNDNLEKVFNYFPRLNERKDQLAATLSGGESQRVKLASELSKRSTGNTFYILDEPTTGLHFEDVNKLLKILHKLVDEGNTVIVIEHNLDVIKTADYLIDLGPLGGVKGGQIVGKGTPEDIANVKKSFTGGFLKQIL